MPVPPRNAKPAFDPSKTMLLIAAWPDNLVAPELVLWGVGLRLRRIQWYSKLYVECAYNDATAKIALPSEYQHFIFADRDVRPGPKTRPFVEAAGPLVACEYPVGNNESWDDPRMLHSGLWRCDRRVLETIQPPWFQRILTPDGGAEKHCVCGYFTAKALAAGIPVTRAGWADHKPK